MGMLEIIQLLSVFFGTLIAAPLIVSKKAKKRMVGLFAVIAGSFFAIIVDLKFMEQIVLGPEVLQLERAPLMKQMLLNPL